MNRTCPHDGCTAPISPSESACKKHWRSLGSVRRNLLFAAYRRWLSNQLSLAELRWAERCIVNGQHWRCPERK